MKVGGINIKALQHLHCLNVFLWIGGIGDVNQHKEMLGMVLDHKLLLIIKLNHMLSLKDAKASNINALNVKAWVQYVREAKSKN